MKRLVTVALVVGFATLAAYIAATWYVGIQVEAALSQPSHQLASVPYLKVMKREYRRGILSSEETLTFELFGDVARMMEGQRQKAPDAPDAGTPGAPLQPLQFTVRSHIRHGPLPDGQVLAAAIIDSELQADQRQMPAVARALSGRTLLSTRTVYGFNGDGESFFTSPALVIALPEPPGRIAWKGARATVHFSANWANYTIAGEAPGLEFDGKAARVAIAGMRLDSEARRVFADDPLFYAGKQKFLVAQASIEERAPGGRSVVLKHIGYDVSAPVNGEFIDILIRVAVQDILVAERNFGPAHYDLGLKHLHARTLAQLQRALMKLQSDPSAMARTANPAEAFAALTTPALKLLEFNPEISLDRISFNSGDGEVVVSAHARLAGVGPEDLKQAPALLAKLDAGADIVLPESLLMTPWGARSDTPEAAQTQMQARARQVAVLVEQGYIQREGALLKSSLGFSGGAFTVNGKAFDPRALQAAGPQPSQPVAPRQPVGNGPLRTR